MTKPTLAVSIVSYNTKDLILPCIQDLYDNQSKYLTEIWVVDNKSQDDSVEVIKQKFPKIKVIANPTNDGFAAGHNVALKQIKTDYILMLNPDSRVPEGVLDQMVDFMTLHPKAGAATCKLADEQGHLQPNCGDFPEGWALINWLFNFDVIASLPSFHIVEPSLYQNVRSVDWISGSFFLLTQPVLQKVGLWNEEYFMYFEDTDYCYKLHQAGYQVMYNPEVKVTHIGGASTNDPHYNQWRGEMIGLIKFYQHRGWLESSLVKILVYKALVLRLVAFSLLGRFKIAQTYYRVLKSI